MRYYICVLKQIVKMIMNVSRLEEVPQSIIGSHEDNSGTVLKSFFFFVFTVLSFAKIKIYCCSQIRLEAICSVLILFLGPCLTLKSTMEAARIKTSC